jgi:hypothetical protein
MQGYDKLYCAMNVALCIFNIDNDNTFSKLSFSGALLDSKRVDVKFNCKSM